jgi:Flp pilus assembly protein TadG
MPALRIAARVVKGLGRFGAGAKGMVAVEFALTGTMLAFGLMNAVDLGYYIYRRMEVENAADVGAQAATITCKQAQLPATTNCPGLNAAITSAIQSTSLGTAVALASGYPTEGYYCTNSSNVLQYVSSVSSKPSNCSAAGNASASPADYLQVQVTTPYQALFGVSVMGVLAWTSINMTSWMRMD